ncbi:MAG: alpha-2-macroglobulin family protein, partial [Chitinophagaceae bacterium]
SVEFFVSNISYIHNNVGGFMVLNRTTGKPLQNAKVTLWETFYNPTERRNEIKSDGHYLTDHSGYFDAQTKKDYSGIMPEISYQHDHLFTGELQYIPYVSSTNTIKDTLHEKTYLFTDRSIYRPGQTVYFKAITFNFNPATHQSEVIQNKKEIIYLYDANNQQVDSLPLVTNDFGSVAGSFVLPTGLLNGQMHIAIKNPDTFNYFSVEDYKRPTFYLQWDTVAHAYQLGDDVMVKGNVISYNQAVIDGATVKYQVIRNTQTRFPFPWSRGISSLPPARQTPITQGETTTDANGNFEVSFLAIPDEQTDSSLNPVFIYTVSVDVTDINGESHHFSYALPIGYTSLQFQIDGADKVNLSKADTLHISSTNLSGKYISSEVNIHIYPLGSPDRFIRDRYWQQPDEFILSKTEYLKYFPHDEYQDENNPTTWKKLPEVIDLKKEVYANTPLVIPFGKLKGGWYVIEVNGKDEHGKAVSAIKYIQTFDPENKKVAFNDPLWISANELTAQPGNKVSWYLSSDQEVKLITQKETLSQTGSVQIIPLNHELKQISLQINEKDRGGIIYNYVTVIDNRLFTQSIRINVPWKNKQLHIQYETFRDKLLPGAKEQWKMKITGTNGQKVSAELLASMYDMSLDAFRPHQWQLPDIYPAIYNKISWTGGTSFLGTASGGIFAPEPISYPNYEKIYPRLNWFGYSPVGFHSGIVYYPMSPVRAPSMLTKQKNENLSEKRLASGITEDTTANNPVQNELQNISVRKNFNETAFFLPQLHTDDSGNVIFSFIMPDALTKWKLTMFAHTKDLRFAYSDKEVITQKPLMIQVNEPRFVRQGDQLSFSAKISNLSKDNLQGNAQLELTDAVTGKEINDLFKNENTIQSFQVKAGQSTAVKWNISVPEDYTGVLEYKVVASAGEFSDGEQDALPVLSNKTLITESLPLNFRGNGDHQIDWEILKDLNTSSMQPLGLTLEYAGNPIWYTVQALPFLDENKQQSSDVMYSRFYANALSAVIAKNIPSFNKIMHTWLVKDTNALKSSLEQNENLKNVLLQETPWVQAAQNEAAQKHRVAEWFESKNFKARMQEAINKLEGMQLSNGGFSWFKDMPDNRYITQQIVTGIGHLKQLKAWPEEETISLNQIVQKAVPYLDARIKENYDQLQKNKFKDQQIGDVEIQYLYMRSFFPDIKMADSINTAYSFFQRLAAKQWLNQSPHLQAMIALVLFRSGDISKAKSILNSLSETAINDSVKGMFWKNNQQSYGWDQSPLEAQVVCIEAFNEINHDDQTVSDLCTWLLSQKQTQHWATNRATADAIYALLIAGSQWTSSSPEVTIKLGNKIFEINNKNGEAGTQYKKEYIPGEEINADMSKVNVSIK